MNLTSYKQNALTWAPEMLKEQYHLCLEAREMCWYNAEDCYGKEREHWLDEYNIAKQQVNILEQVANERGIKL